MKKTLEIAGGSHDEFVEKYTEIYKVYQDIRPEVPQSLDQEDVSRIQRVLSVRRDIMERAHAIQEQVAIRQIKLAEVDEATERLLDSQNNITPIQSRKVSGHRNLAMSTAHKAEALIEQYTLEINLLRASLREG